MRSKCEVFIPITGNSTKTEVFKIYFANYQDVNFPCVWREEENVQRKIYGCPLGEHAMKWRKWIENWDMTSLKISAPFLEMEWKPQDEDKAAAWDLYIELLTRITTQPIDAEHGDEKTALDSVYSLFPVTRQVLKNNTRNCTEFTKLAIVVLNQVVRPFTTKWHRLYLQGVFDNPAKCSEFRIDLATLQVALKKYTKMLADMAGVEDLTVLEGE